MPLTKKQIAAITPLLEIGAQLRETLDDIERKVELAIDHDINFGEVWNGVIMGELSEGIAEIKEQMKE